MRHKWILVMCAGVILVQVTNANPVKNSAEEDPTNDDSSESQKQSIQFVQLPSADNRPLELADSVTVGPTKIDQINKDESGENNEAEKDASSTEKTIQQNENATKVPNENKSDENNANEDAAFSTTEASNRNGKKVSFINNAARQRQTTTTTEKPSTICTKSGLNYDCILQGIQLSQDESADFGLTWKNNPQKNVTFENSRLAFLPKKLIEAFPQMELLNAEDLQMAEIENGAFDKAVNLKRLYLKNNMITTINHFTGAPQLLHVDLSNNRINHIDKNAFLNNIVLETILLNNNNISTLPKTNTVQNLKVLNVANNEIGRISDHQFSKNNKLENLDVSFNKLSYFNLLQLDNKPVLIIDVSHNKLESLYIPMKVRVLNAANNSIQVLTVNECYAEKLDVSYNQITNVKVLQKCSDLKKLDLSHNRLQSFDLIKSCRKLFDLNLAHNHLFEIDLPTNFHPLQMLDLSNNQLSFGPPNKLHQLKKLKLNNNKFIEFKFDNMKQLNYIEMSNNEWDCRRIKSIMEEKARYVTDAKEVCHGRQSQNGICCKDYVRPFQERFSEIMREIFVHENINSKDQENCKKAKPKHDKLHFDAQMLQRKLNEMNEIIEKFRKHNGVSNDISDNSTAALRRVIQYQRDRNMFNSDLLTRRKQETKNTHDRFVGFNNTAIAIMNEHKTLQAMLKDAKLKEASLKKESKRLERTRRL